MRYGASSALRRAMQLKFKSGESGIFQTTKIKFARHEGRISFGAR